ncbi:MAG TPA: hypothetical protein VNA30_01370 [Mycobacteriales bacterium]|nr:hypothetical protein [Mycobacteriales bacterium]
MAKALFGQVASGVELQLLADVRRLRGRVSELEAELARVRRLNDALASAVTVEDDLSLLTLDPEPALT